MTEKKSSQAAVSRVNPERSLQLALAAATVALENSAKDIVVMDMTGQTASFDYFVIATGSSQRQLRAISSDIDHKLQGELRDRRMNIDGFENTNWIVLDYGTVIIHLFDETTRAFYSIEALWADAKRIDLAKKMPHLKWR